MQNRYIGIQAHYCTYSSIQYKLVSDLLFTIFLSPTNINPYVLILVNKIYQPIMEHVHDEQLTLFYFILLTLLAANYDLLLTLQLFIVMFFDVLFDHTL